MRWLMQFLYICSLLPVVIQIKRESASLIGPFSNNSQNGNLLNSHWAAASSVWFAHPLSTMVQSSNNKERPLSEVYDSIIQQTLSMTRPWPDSDGFANCCLDNGSNNKDNQNATNTGFQVPTFPEGTGPLGVFALTRDNTHPGNERLVQTCLNAFDHFSQELNALLGLPEDYQYFDLVRSLVPHITVAIFQEHPRLLPKERQDELEDFYFFTNEDGSKLAASLAQQTSRYSPIQLTLHSLMIAPDGAMIAGFVDDDNDNNNYAKLKNDILTNAKQVMDKHNFTSRPKNLIHITCGRVVRKQGVPLELQTQSAIQELVRRYNQQVFPQIVADLKSSRNSGGGGATLWLEQMTVLRNDVWLCEKNTVYGVGKLHQGRDDTSMRQNG